MFLVLGLLCLGLSALFVLMICFAVACVVANISDAFLILGVALGVVLARVSNVIQPAHVSWLLALVGEGLLDFSEM